MTIHVVTQSPTQNRAHMNKNNVENSLQNVDDDININSSHDSKHVEAT